MQRVFWPRPSTDRSRFGRKTVLVLEKRIDRDDVGSFGRQPRRARPKRVAATIVVAIVLVGAAASLTTTRFGVFVFFDLLGDLGDEALDISPATSPIDVDRVLSGGERLELPRDLSQPSGLVVDQSTNRYLVTTDQGELFELDPQLEVVERRLLVGGPLLLRQGSVEAITLVQQRRLPAATRPGTASKEPSPHDVGGCREQSRQWLVAGGEGRGIVDSRGDPCRDVAMSFEWDAALADVGWPG